jgi:hypothetical protein
MTYEDGLGYSCIVFCEVLSVCDGDSSTLRDRVLFVGTLQSRGYSDTRTGESLTLAERRAEVQRLCEGEA